jgi:hypothetical protein
MKKNIVFNMFTGEELTFINNLSAIDNLINCYIQEKFGSFALYNVQLRQKLSKNILFGKRSLSIGDYSILINRR